MLQKEISAAANGATRCALVLGVLVLAAAAMPASFSWIEVREVKIKIALRCFRYQYLGAIVIVWRHVSSASN
jgi:hypothetical protein